ncbi:DinB family protein [Compostibacter hankyongensis]|uniref:DinB family protein n=1 Tax=Compostibacter hankyongensis TaxID=1007089 RepID=A0ABP8FDG9_9BACT
MYNNISKIRGFRLFLLRHIDDLSAGQLNIIPPGHNNNIIWNLAHLTAVVQMMCYERSGLPFTIEGKYVSPYLSGTRPETFVEEAEIKNIRELFIRSIDRLQSDFDKNMFGRYTPSVRISEVYGFTVTNIHEAIDYLLYHEGLHSGSILSLKHLV